MSKNLIWSARLCPACKKEIKFGCKKPGHREVTIFLIDCKSCKAKLRFKVSFALPEDNQPKGTLKVNGAVLEENPYILAMIRGEEKWEKQTEGLK